MVSLPKEDSKNADDDITNGQSATEVSTIVTR